MPFAAKALRVVWRLAVIRGASSCVFLYLDHDYAEVLKKKPVDLDSRIADPEPSGP